MIPRTGNIDIKTQKMDAGYDYRPKCWTRLNFTLAQLCIANKSLTVLYHSIYSTGLKHTDFFDFSKFISHFKRHY